MNDQKDFFKENGYLVIDGLLDPKDFFEIPPKERGEYHYNYKKKPYFFHPIDSQVPESFSRHRHPKYKYAHSQIRIKLQKILGENLYNTYCYDRFYFEGQDLKRHVDREQCEISLTFQISSNSKNNWPISFIDYKGIEHSVSINDGQAILYKGHEILHWRDPLKSRHSFLRKSLNKLFFKKDDTYHHQVFFHYVRENGEFAHFAYSF